MLLAKEKQFDGVFDVPPETVLPSFEIFVTVTLVFKQATESVGNISIIASGLMLELIGPTELNPFPHALEAKISM